MELRRYPNGAFTIKEADLKEAERRPSNGLSIPKLDAMMAYHQLEEELQRKHMGQWVIIHGQEQVGGGYDSSSSAYDAAREMELDPRS